MTDAELKIECFKAANQDVRKAEWLYGWICSLPKMEAKFKGEDPEVSRWFNVDESLPPMETFVVVVGEDENMRTFAITAKRIPIPAIDLNDETWRWETSYGYFSKSVTFWKYLPQAVKEPEKPIWLGPGKSYPFHKPTTIKGIIEILENKHKVCEQEREPALMNMFDSGRLHGLQMAINIIKEIADE